MYFLYSILLLLFLLIYFPLSFLKDPFLRKYRIDLGERFGIYPPDLKERLKDSRPLWIHAVSVGEMMAASPLISALMKGKPGEGIILSAVTATGRGVAKERFPNASAILFFPLDFRWIVKRSLEAIQPRAVLLTETELWPHFLRGCSEQGIPCILINGRISEGSFRRYRWVRGFFRRMIKDMPLFCMQSEVDLLRIVGLGADPSRVVCTGNLKFDQYLKEEGENPRRQFLQDLMIEDHVPIFIAGSTHRGEEEAAIEAFLRAKVEVDNLLFILAPRHPERFSEVARLLGQRGLAFSRRSQIRPAEEREGDVILLDTMGELGKIYSLGTIIFVGGSLTPIGGHNILEPAFYGWPILFGPHMKNFEEITDLFLSGGGALSVRDPSDLAQKLLWLLHHSQEAEAMGERARSILCQHRGAMQRTWDLLKKYL
jgi:3-deoxy-D-manno-octulosonic-acid transferase